MAFRANPFGRNRHSFCVLTQAVAAGFLIGLAVFLIKVPMSSVALDAGFILSLLVQPVTYLAGFVAIAGFLILQKSLHMGKVSVVAPITAGLGIVVPIVLAVLFLSEIVSIFKMAGIVLILVGIAGLRE